MVQPKATVSRDQLVSVQVAATEADLVEVPLPLPEAAHPAHTLSPDIAGEHRAEPVPPVAHGLVADINPALGQKVFDVAHGQREADMHYHHQADHLGR